MRYIRNNSTDPYFNMAFDEYCLEQLTCHDPVFYLWQNRPSVIVGFNQNVNTEVNLDYLKSHDIALARRVTGGGAVYHDLGNLNYTITGCSEDLERDYPRYTEIILNALRELGVPATLSGRNDILVEGRKVSGFAKRVSKNRLMVHGTLMFNVDVERLTHVLTPPHIKLQSKGVASVRSRVANLCDYLPHIPDVDTFKRKLEGVLSRNYKDEEYPLTEKDLHQIHAQAQKKFAQWEWIYGRSPKATLHHSARLACGSVEVHLTLKENRIASCRFEGDFIGNLPASEVEHLLTNIPYDAVSIKECLSQIDIPQYFDGMTADDLVGLML